MSEKPIQTNGVLGKGEFQIIRLLSSMALTAVAVQQLVSTGRISPLNILPKVAVLESGPGQAAFILKRMGVKEVIAIDDERSTNGLFFPIERFYDGINKQRVTVKNWLKLQDQSSFPLIVGFNIAPYSIFGNVSPVERMNKEALRTANIEICAEISRILTVDGIVLLQGLGRPSYSEVFDPLKFEEFIVKEKAPLPESCSDISLGNQTLSNFVDIAAHIPMILLHK